MKGGGIKQLQEDTKKWKSMPTYIDQENFILNKIYKQRIA